METQRLQESLPESHVLHTLSHCLSHCLSPCLSHRDHPMVLPKTLAPADFKPLH
jgi:hypothetical protein